MRANSVYGKITALLSALILFAALAAPLALNAVQNPPESIFATPNAVQTPREAPVRESVFPALNVSEIPELILPETNAPEWADPDWEAIYVLMEIAEAIYGWGESGYTDIYWQYELMLGIILNAEILGVPYTDAGGTRLVLEEDILGFIKEMTGYDYPYMPVISWEDISYRDGRYTVPLDAYFYYSDINIISLDYTNKFIHAVFLRAVDGYVSSYEITLSGKSRQYDRIYRIPEFTRLNPAEAIKSAASSNAADSGSLIDGNPDTAWRSASIGSDRYTHIASGFYGEQEIKLIRLTFNVSSWMDFNRHALPEEIVVSVDGVPLGKLAVTDEMLTPGWGLVIPLPEGTRGSAVTISFTKTKPGWETDSLCITELEVY